VLRKYESERRRYHGAAAITVGGGVGALMKTQSVRATLTGRHTNINTMIIKYIYDDRLSIGEESRVIGEVLVKVCAKMLMSTIQRKFIVLTEKGGG
jgi:hypothetical protein